MKHLTIAEQLSNKNIKPSLQRIKILEYLQAHHNHPTADQIYLELRGEIPTLSKATIYNTLNLFLEAKLVRLINIEDNEMRYDALLYNHGHFKCIHCGRIYDFQLNTDVLEERELEHFQIMDKNVYYKGMCPDCLDNTNKTKKEVSQWVKKQLQLLILMWKN